MKKVIYIFILIAAYQFNLNGQANLEIENDGVIEKSLVIGENSTSDNNEMVLYDYDSNGSCLLNINGSTIKGYIGFDEEIKGVTGTVTNHAFQFWSGGIPRMHFKNNGYVGLGTTNPGAPLHVYSPGPVNAPVEIVKLSSNVSKKPLILFSEAAAGSLDMAILYDGVGNRMQILNQFDAPSVTWTNGNRMGIGTENPRSTMDVKGDIALNQPGSSALILQPGATSNTELIFTGLDFRLRSHNGSANVVADRRVIVESKAREVVLDADDDILFEVNNIEKMQLRQNGAWGLNKDLPPTASFHVKQNTSNLPALRIEDATTSDNWDWEAGTDDLVLSFNNVEVGVYNSLGFYSSASDRRLKKDITLIQDGALTSLLKLKPCSYYFNRDQESKNRTIGFIAQELQEYFPLLVTETTIDNKDILGVSYSAISAITVKAIQEQNQEIQTLSKNVLQQDVRDADIKQVVEALADIEKVM